MVSLRDEIEPHRAGARWLLFDPLRHRYFATTRAELAALADGEGGSFARANELVRDCSAEHSRALGRRAAAARESWWALVLHRYLFVRIPLARPDPWLDYYHSFERGRWFKTGFNGTEDYTLPVRPPRWSGRAGSDRWVIHR